MKIECDTVFFPVFLGRKRQKWRLQVLRIDIFKYEGGANLRSLDDIIFWFGLQLKKTLLRHNV